MITLDMPANKNIRRLFAIAEKEERLCVGLMSGTSLDGLDIALCRFKGSGQSTTFKLVNFTTIPYPEEFRNAIRRVFAQRQADMEEVCLLNAHIGRYHAALILDALKQWNIAPASVDFIASHGQTIYHAPVAQHKRSGYPNATLQIGDGDHIAMLTGILTISDFRQKHIAAGGEGAPLALYGDVLLGSKAGENRVLLNMGGIANLTWLPGQLENNAILCTDIGPGNTLIDAACKHYYNIPYDEDGRIAFSGTVNTQLLTALLDHPFFDAPLPKTTGPEVFNLDYVNAAQQKSDTVEILPTDLIATLAAFTAEAIARFIKKHVNTIKLKLYASGGGASNPFIMQTLAKLLPEISINSTDALGIPADAKEAILFALLGNEAIVGEPLHIGNNPAVLMGKFSFPA